MAANQGMWLKAFSWNLLYLNTMKAIQTSRNFEYFIMETPFAILEVSRSSSVYWWQSFSDGHLPNWSNYWSHSQDLASLMWRCSTGPALWMHATDSHQQPYSFFLLQLTFAFTPACITDVHRAHQSRTGCIAFIPQFYIFHSPKKSWSWEEIRE